MVCIYCGHETKVTNSRHQKRTNATWRRRKCIECSAIFTTTEVIELAQSLSVQSESHLEPFSRDKLLLSLYESLKHRNTALGDAAALTNTVIGHALSLSDRAVIDREALITVTITVLERFDLSAATHYRAFHPLT